MVSRGGGETRPRQRLPVEIVNPFWGIYAGITRQEANGNPKGGWHPEQKLTLEETLRGFTSGAAYAGFAEDRLG